MKWINKLKWVIFLFLRKLQKKKKKSTKKHKQVFTTFQKEFSYPVLSTVLKKFDSNWSLAHWDFSLPPYLQNPLSLSHWLEGVSIFRSLQICPTFLLQDKIPVCCLGYFPELEGVPSLQSEGHVFFLVVCGCLYVLIYSLSTTSIIKA